MTQRFLASEQGYKFTLSYDTNLLNLATNFRVEICRRQYSTALVRLINRYGAIFIITDAIYGHISEPIHIDGNAPQIAFCIDGSWQRDPIQWGAHNFNFSW